MYRYPVGVIALFMFIGLGFAQQPLKDYAGYKDPELFTRMPNYSLPYKGSFEEREFDAHLFFVNTGKASERKSVEGHFTRYTYDFDKTAGGARPSTLQILRNYQSAAARLGGKVLFDSGSATTILIEKDGKEIWVEVLPRNAASMYHLRIVERETMKQDVVANADAFRDGLKQSGHVEVPGIFFDTGKAEVKPESDAALREVAKLLQTDPTLKVWVVGHTDNTGTVEGNMSLSSARAAAVVKVLVSQMGLDAAKRLAPHGAGPYAPVAANETEEGRAKNRRVELVKQP
ncbi:MAG: hypothetical protein EHM61_07560 [Acidobacteria bacterium]|nr:MAG: hypothetical protein EHM61_07560 [Acidobacteriota bacterium]